MLAHKKSRTLLCSWRQRIDRRGRLCLCTTSFSLHWSAQSHELTRTCIVMLLARSLQANS